MNSIAASNQTVIVPFHGQELFLVNHEGEPYTPMKPIVENMGMDWKSQFTKLKQRFSSTVVEITIVAKDGKARLMTCLPVRKLAGWLYSISPNKVKPELREKVVMYQEECDDVLWQYWTNFQRTDAKQRESLVAACDKLAIGNTLRSDVYTMIANHFGYEKVTQIPTPLLPEAVAFVYEMILVRQKPSNTMNFSALKTNSHALSVHMVYCKEWFDSVRVALEVLNPDVTRRIAGQFDEGWSAAKLVNRSLCNISA